VGARTVVEARGSAGAVHRRV